MKIRTFGYYIKEGLKSIVKNRVMSIASISTVAAALFILGIFMILVANVNSLIGDVENTIEIKAFLEDNVTTIQRNQIEKDIKAISGVKDVRYESKEEALEKVKNRLGNNQELTKGFEAENPFPAAYIIKVDNPEVVKSVSSQISKIGGIYEVKDGQQYIDKIISITRLVKVSSLVLMIILGTISIFLISNTIKLAVYARKREINIMKYIGATDWFIRWPFLIEGVLLGIFGAIISILVLYFGYRYVNSAVSAELWVFALVPPSQIISSLVWQFTLIGMVIGGLGSSISLRKFLSV
ncbi:permease-like cell division protein FtsX [Fonticella tunisiensis]|nr:permease-like cell division protein FtsX [Fonticella tunisiensis]